MRTLFVVATVCLSACTGNWSNDDLEFIGSVPKSEDLRSKLPTSASAMQGIRRDPLSVGDPSKAYTDTKGASDSFNGIVDFITGALDTVVKITPTTRSPDTRIWGPWNDPNNPGFQVRVTITRPSDSDFNWAIEMRPRTGDYFETAGGSFQATESIKKGTGNFHVDTKTIRERLKSTTDLNPVDKIDVTYDTQRPPKLVQMQFLFSPSGASNLSTAGYEYHEAADTSGSMAFVVKGSDPNITEAKYESQWLKTGTGRATLTVVSGNYAGATATECWDSTFKVVYAKQSWPGGIDVGTASACPEITGL